MSIVKWGVFSRTPSGQFNKRTRLRSGAHYLKQLKFFGWNICFLAKKCPLEVWGVFFADAAPGQFNRSTKFESDTLYLEQLKIFLRGCLIFREKMSIRSMKGVFSWKPLKDNLVSTQRSRPRALYTERLKNFFWSPPKPKKMSVVKWRVFLM